ncbi:BNR repeat-containing protein [Geofilum rubicundum]|nr:BNR repeat-containing protein [Geofilum rubicundum]
MKTGFGWMLLMVTLMVTSCNSRPMISEVGPGWSKTSVNATIFRKNSLVSDATHQYISYYDSTGQMVLGKRTLNSDEWELQVTPYKGNVWDAHNVISIMVDGNGYLHVSWDHHGGPLNYARSVAPGSLELGPKLNMVDGFEDDGVTYPEFYTLPDGDLLFVYRYGASGAGNIVLNRYDLENQTWSRVHDNLVSGEGKRNAYWQMSVDNAGGIHLSWVWRDTWDVSTNHNLCYAYSPDGGVSWETSEGEALEVPVTYERSEVIWEIPQKSSLINQTSITTDGAGNPAIATYWTAQGDSVPQYFVVYHQNGSWQRSQASERQTPFYLGGGGTRRIPMSRPQLLAEETSTGTRFYLVYRDEEADNRIVLASAATGAVMSWTTRVVEDLEVGQWEPSFDTELWRNSGELSLFVQKVGQGDGGEKAEEMAPQPVKVFQLAKRDLKRYFK